MHLVFSTVVDKRNIDNSTKITNKIMHQNLFIKILSLNESKQIPTRIVKTEVKPIRNFYYTFCDKLM